MYGFGVDRFPCQLCQCRTSGVHCSLSSKERCYFVSTQMAFPKTRPFPSPNSRKMCMARAVLTPSQGPRRTKEKHTNEFSKSPNRQTAGSSDKLQESDPLFVVHLLHHLQFQKASGAPLAQHFRPQQGHIQARRGHTRKGRQTAIWDCQRCFL